MADVLLCDLLSVCVCCAYAFVRFGCDCLCVVVWFVVSVCLSFSPVFVCAVFSCVCCC